MEALAVFVVLVLVTGAIAGTVRRTRAQRAAEAGRLFQVGFRECPGEAGVLAGVVRELHGSERLELRRPWKRATSGEPVYWYEVRSESGAERTSVAADEFLCTLPRPSPEPCVFYLKPEGLGSGLGARLLGQTLSALAPDGLHPLDLGREPRSAALLAAFGPRGASLERLLGPDLADLLAQAGKHGVFAVRARGDRCALEVLGHYARKAKSAPDWRQSWSFVEGLASRDPGSSPKPSSDPVGAGGRRA
jgi:hypothetical protein